MKTIFSCVLCIALLGGCTNYRQTHLETGEVGYSIQCGLSSKSWNACYVMAGDICGKRGYEVVSIEGDGLGSYGKHLWIKCK